MDTATTKLCYVFGHENYGVRRPGLVFTHKFYCESTCTIKRKAYGLRAMSIEKLMTGLSCETSKRAYEGEFGQVAIKDVRNVRRLNQCFARMMNRPGKSIPEQSSNWAEAKGFYRLLEHPDLTDEVILEAHRRATFKRAARSAEGVYLAIQDTTSLNFTSHEKLEGQGPIGNTEKTTGLFVHSTVLMGADSGQIHGLIDSKIYAREGNKRKRQKPGARNREKLAEKESIRWVESFERSLEGLNELGAVREKEGGRSKAVQVVNVADREGDIYELLCLAQKHREAGMGLVVRSQHNREQTGAEERIWESLQASEEKGRLSINVARAKGIQNEQVKVAVRFQQVNLQVPAHKAKYLGMSETPTVWVVEVRSLGKGPSICWRLLSSLPVESFEQAARLVEWYAKRWQIEVFHRVLKTGCRVEKHQVRTLGRLLPLIALDMVVAIFLMSLLSMARSQPQAPAKGWLCTHTRTALCQYLHKQKLSPETLTLAQAVHHIACLGGFLARKSDGLPGAEVLWRGIKKLETITEAWIAFQQLHKNVGND